MMSAFSAGVAPVGGHHVKCAPAMEVGMVSRVGVVSDDFRKQVLGYGLTTAEILYRMPDHPSLLQTYVWQNYDLCPKFPELFKFLAFWQQKLEGPLYSVTVAHSKLVKPAELRTVDGVFRLH
jgi:uncharacterized protein Usg